jgi:phosphatidate cytidylyltransferase
MGHRRLVKDLSRRVAVAAIAIVGLILLLSVAHRGMLALFVVALSALIISGALWEFYRLAHAKGFRPMVNLGVAASVGYVAASYMVAQGRCAPPVPSMVLALALVGALLGRFKKLEGSLGDVAVTLLGLVFVTATLSCIVRILYAFPENNAVLGTRWVIYLITVTKLSDLGGYFVGMLLGRHKLAPRLSPAKTLEGLFGGIAFALVGSLCFGWSGLLGMWEAVGLGLALAIAGQLGDLSESLFKRDAGVKDSGRIPGLGGVLDMVDSLLLAGPLVYGYLWATVL